MQIAIDGPAAAGKSSVSKELARRLGYKYIDTGAMYRSVTLLAIRNNLDCTDEESLVSLLEKHIIDVNDRVATIDGEDVSKEIRGEEVTSLVSICCTPKDVREKMVALQQKMAMECDSVMEGRDIGTVVLPNAELKIFMTASPLERAQRRQNDSANPELKNVDISKIESEIKRRDTLDSTREIAPLKAAKDAIALDSTGMSIDAVCDKIIEILKQKHFNH